MHHRTLPLLATGQLFGALACDEPTSTRPSQSLASTAPASSAALTAQINGLINALFAPKDRFRKESSHEAT